ncbi:MAG TPA: hypothetical protein HA327_00805, partial [Candidatus Poseidoniaceae archaeon]|nr:hypothetical protein [Candidatus Poseidoniaceae archaeon]
MGLFDRFKRRVKEVADEVDTDSLTVIEDSAEAKEIIAARQETIASETSYSAPTENAEE